MVTISEIVIMKNKIKRIKREFFLPGLYFLFLYNSPTFADNVLISGRSDYVNPPVIQLPSDSMIRLAQVELLPKRFVPQNNLINDCYYCVDENRQWYQFKDELIRAIRTCRCDYLDTRIETAFQHGAIKAYVLVIGKFDLNRIFTIDSVEVKLLNENVSTHTVLSMKKKPFCGKQSIGQMQPDTNPDKYVDDILKSHLTRGSFTLYGDWKIPCCTGVGGFYLSDNNSEFRKRFRKRCFRQVRESCLL